jgi:hypothetical protein
MMDGRVAAIRDALDVEGCVLLVHLMNDTINSHTALHCEDRIPALHCIANASLTDMYILH